MSEREELEAEIKAIEEAWLFAEDTGDMADRRRHLATALLVFCDVRKPTRRGSGGCEVIMCVCGQAERTYPRTHGDRERQGRPSAGREETSKGPERSLTRSSSPKNDGVRVRAGLLAPGSTARSAFPGLMCPSGSCCARPQIQWRGPRRIGPLAGVYRLPVSPRTLIRGTWTRWW